MERKRVTLTLTSEQAEQVKRRFTESGYERMQSFLRAAALSEPTPPADLEAVIKEQLFTLATPPAQKHTVKITILFTPAEYEQLTSQAARWLLAPSLYAARNLIGVAPWAAIPYMKLKKNFARVIQLIAKS